MAADYIEQIRSVRPSGPYRLLGWSCGGVIAHKMAIQLQAAGEEVASLVIMDMLPSGEQPEEAVTDRAGEPERTRRPGPTG